MRILECITSQHDLLLVLLAATICAIGSWITIRLFVRTTSALGSARQAWSFLGGVVSGSTVWCTHFVAMLAYTPGASISYDPSLTALSLVIAVIVSIAALRLGASRFRFSDLLGGAVFGFGVAAMHYTGMAAYTVDAIVTWDFGQIVWSIAAALGFGALAFQRATHPLTRWCRYGATASLALAIVLLHFTGMSALTLIPFAPPAGALTGTTAHVGLAFAVGGIGLLVLGSGFASHMLDLRLRQESTSKLKHLLEASVDGMVIENNGVIIDTNAAFLALADISRESLLGQSFQALMGLPDGFGAHSLVRAQLSPARGDPVPVEIAISRNFAFADSGTLTAYAVRDLRSRLAQEQKIRLLGSFDSLTGLPNRAQFLERLEHLAATLSSDRKLAVLAIDLDRFKEVNDLYGHAAGDDVLRELSHRMRDVLTEAEFVARLGGDEFVALTTVSFREEALDLVRRLEAQLFAPVTVEGQAVLCGASIGVALYPDDADTTSALLNNADLAMYRAKSSLEETVCFYEISMDEMVRARRRMVADLREAIAEQQFELHYQVQTSVRSGEITGYEVLLRWKHPERGYISPMDFIPLAEETGLILPIGEWVLRTACASAAGWDSPHRIAVNLSAVQLSQIDLPRLIHAVLLETGLPPRRLELEITETSLIRDLERSVHILRQIKAMGVTIAMDDFGTGYSSLSTLRSFPFDKIKLDRSFMKEVDGSQQARAIIRAVLALGESLEITVLAEGVETANQLQLLHDLGCNEAQGYYLGRPGPRAEPPLLARPDSAAA